MKRNTNSHQATEQYFHKPSNRTIIGVRFVRIHLKSFPKQETRVQNKKGRPNRRQRTARPPWENGVCPSSVRCRSLCSVLGRLVLCDLHEDKHEMLMAEWQETETTTGMGRSARIPSQWRPGVICRVWKSKFSQRKSVCSSTQHELRLGWGLRESSTTNSSTHRLHWVEGVGGMMLTALC